MITHPRQVDQQRRRNRQAVVFVSVVLGMLLLLGAANALGGDGEDSSAARQPSEPDRSETHHVVYEIGGSAIEASVTLSTPTGTQQMDANARVDGDDLHEMTVDSGEFLYISAQNQNEMGSIVCRIIVDGAVVAENESTASYGIATCEGNTR